MIGMGDTVYITADVIDVDGNLMTPDTSGKGMVVASKGLDVAVVQWGQGGEYRYAEVPHHSLKKIEVPRRRA